VGAGIRLLSSPRIASDFTLGTAFQFADMAGVRAHFGHCRQYLAGYRFQHISNGGINEPNPGINFSQLYLQYNF
jgi:lipid A 3-O-deacylase